MDISNSSRCRHRRCHRKNPPSESSVLGEVRDWAALPDNVLLNIFLRLGSCEIMWGAEAVCKAWRRVTVEEPELWRHIHIIAVPEWSSIEIAVRDAVDRSAGLCEAFLGPWDDESLLYLAERSPSLKMLHLHLSRVLDASYEVLVEAIKKLPLLEDLEISPPYEHISASDRFESVCKARPLLKNLKTSFTMPSNYSFGEACLEERLDGDIYRTPLMCELRSLELSNYIFSHSALTAILDNCPLLESLHITGFSEDSMDGELQAKCARVKNLNLPFSYDEDEQETEEDEDEDLQITMDISSSSRRRYRKNPPSESSVLGELRDWAALPDNVLLNIFLRLGSCEIMWGAEAVCKAWRRVMVEEPELWRHIHITAVPEWSSIEIAVRDAVDRSAGLCEAFLGPWDDESLLYLAERSPSLKMLHLHLSRVLDASYEVLVEAIKKLPLLEDLEISPPYEHISASDRFFRSVCKARPLLKNLKISFTIPSDYSFGEACLEERYDGDIYRTPLMSQLHSLELSNYIFSRSALTAILDNCPLLESLHITGFCADSMDAELQAKCARVENLNLPFSSDEDEEENEEDEDSEDEF